MGLVLLDEDVAHKNGVSSISLLKQIHICTPVCIIP